MPRTSSSAPSRQILEAALQGLESQREKLDEQISEVRRLLSGRGNASKQTKSASGSENTAGARRGGARKKRALSAEARARIAAAQKKRWAAFRKSQG
jgi:peptidoglycan hydrolase CwlO-like protein